MASSIAAITIPRSIDFSRATASAICSNSSLLALTAAMSLSFIIGRAALPAAFRPLIPRTGMARPIVFHLVRPARPVVSARFAFLFLALLQRLGVQRVGEDELCLRDVVDRQRNLGCLAGGGVIAAQTHGVAVDAQYDPAETAASVHRHRHLDFGKMPGIAFEI